MKITFNPEKLEREGTFCSLTWNHGTLLKNIAQTFHPRKPNEFVEELIITSRGITAKFGHLLEEEDPSKLKTL